MKVPVSVSVNGRAIQRDVEPRLLLVHFLRDVAGLTGTKIGCDTSQCGACTVLVDGLPVGMSFIAGKWEDARVLSLGYAFEQSTHAIRPPTFVRSVEDRAETAPLLAPARP